MLLSDPGDFVLPESGILHVRDFESGEHVYLDASNPKIRKAYARKKRGEHRRILDSFKACDIAAVEISTEEDAADALAGFFRIREKRIR